MQVPKAQMLKDVQTPFCSTFGGLRPEILQSFPKMELKITSHLGGPESTTLYPFFRVLISGHVRACILTYNALLLHSSVEQYLEEEVKVEICRTG